MSNLRHWINSGSSIQLHPRWKLSASLSKFVKSHFAFASYTISIGFFSSINSNIFYAFWCRTIHNFAMFEQTNKQTKKATISWAIITYGTLACVCIKITIVCCRLFNIQLYYIPSRRNDYYYLCKIALWWNRKKETKTKPIKRYKQTRNKNWNNNN